MTRTAPATTAHPWPNGASDRATRSAHTFSIHASYFGTPWSILGKHAPVSGALVQQDLEHQLDRFPCGQGELHRSCEGAQVGRLWRLAARWRSRPQENGSIHFCHAEVEQHKQLRSVPEIATMPCRTRPRLCFVNWRPLADPARESRCVRTSQRFAKGAASHSGEARAVGRGE